MTMGLINRAEAQELYYSYAETGILGMLPYKSNSDIDDYFVFQR